jgi:hypothetical protein
MEYPTQHGHLDVCSSQESPRPEHWEVRHSQFKLKDQQKGLKTTRNRVTLPKYDEFNTFSPQKMSPVNNLYEVKVN